MKSYVLDACALIAFLGNEKGGDKVENLFRENIENECQIIINKINLLEVYYDTLRKEGIVKAENLLEIVYELPVTVNQIIYDDLFYEAGRLKATYKLSLADSIAFAEAIVRKADFVTADHHEFDAIEKTENVQIIWIR